MTDSKRKSSGSDLNVNRFDPLINHAQESLEKYSDEELMQHYQNGSQIAFQNLYSRHSGRILGFLRKRVIANEANDLLQNVFFKLHRARHTYNPSMPFLPWLFVITKAQFTDFLRSRQNQKTQLTELTSETPEPKVLIEDHSRLQNVEAAVEFLPERLKQAIQLRYLEDWSFSQIAEHFNTSQENVRQMISRSLKQLKSKLIEEK